MNEPPQNGKTEKISEKYNVNCRCTKMMNEQI